ncbi:hypothetical protein BC830DRAFT_1134633, partial [Chytriomyces sp. MP71]
MFVGNHLLAGMDLAFTIPLIYTATGVYPRGVADTFHFIFPIWSHLMALFGGFKGTPHNCRTLMAQGQPLMLLPGGANEVMKDERMEPYGLVWKDRVGFVKLALEHGYTIIPFGIVGFEDMVRIAFSLPVDFFFRLIGDKRGRQDAWGENAHSTSKRAPFPDMRLPVVYPWLRLQRSYLVIGDPIECVGNVSDRETVY